ncbi:hypothetical protein BS17DRAFT_812912 [Gyrodon lividus]|nr:hypothetical protein BS17DRAFT_812912 [Gyrodon lividus]
MSDNVVRKAYEAKKASKKCILSRISLTHDELNVMNKQIQLLQAMQGEQIEELSATDEKLRSIKGILVGHGIKDLEDDMAVGHAIYANELIALTIADMQLDQMSSLVGFLEQHGLPELEDNDRSLSSDLSNALLDDLVYEDQ